MATDEVESQRLALSRVLTEAEQLLRLYGIQHWASMLAESCRLIDIRDFRGIQLIRSSFGGMGSFNDIVIHPMNGHRIAPADVDAVNEQFQELKRRIYELAFALSRHEAQAGHRD